MIENLHVTTQRTEMQGKYEQGFWDGHASLCKPLPIWWGQKTLLTLTAYQRGYFVGREVASIERGEK